MIEFFIEILKLFINYSKDLSIDLLLGLVIALIFYSFDKRIYLGQVLSRAGIKSWFLILIIAFIVPNSSIGSVFLSIYLYKKGLSLGKSLFFMTISVFLNPLSMISIVYLFGKSLAQVYIGGIFILGIIVGLVFYIWGGACGKRLNETNVSLLEIFSEFIVYVLISNLIFSILMTSLPKNLNTYMEVLPKDLGFTHIGLLALTSLVDPIVSIGFGSGLIASGTNPGQICTYLVFGFISNFYVLFTIARFIGKKISGVYFFILASGSFLFGTIANKILAKKFHFLFNFDEIDYKLNIFYEKIIQIPNAFKLVALAIILIFGFRYSYKKRFSNRGLNV